MAVRNLVDRDLLASRGPLFVGKLTFAALTY